MWLQVEKFLQMAEQAMKVRREATEALHEELESARSEKSKVPPRPLCCTASPALHCTALLHGRRLAYQPGGCCVVAACVWI
jgi:hypothetical protein